MDSSETSNAFRWQALFQSSRDAVFVLDHRRRLLFANRAWEALTGRSFADLRGLACTRRKSSAEHAALVYVLCPPPEALAGQAIRVQRPVPHAPTGPPWWEIDYLPIRGDDSLVAIIGRIRGGASGASAVVRPLTEAEALLRRRTADFYRLESLDGRFPTLAPVLTQARLAAGSRCPVLILGEAGTGKHWLARAIHEAGTQRDRPFLPLDAAALPPSAVAGVLFGPLGLYRSDGAGTLYIHEPARLSLDVQDELAQRLDAGGDGHPRIIVGSPTVDGPARLVEQGVMLKALYDGLSVLVIRLPPLRERTADLPALVPAVLDRIGRTSLALDDDAWECIRAYPWPGNITELQFAIMSASQTARGERIAAGDLPLPVRQARHAEPTPPPTEQPAGLDTLLEQLERRLIREALHAAKGNQSRAAEMLSIWRPRLIRRMKALGISADEPVE